MVCEGGKDIFDKRQKIKEVVYLISHTQRGSVGMDFMGCELPMDGAAWSPTYHKMSLLQPATTDRVKPAGPHQQKVISV